MSHTTPITERDRAWFEELSGVIARGRSALLARQHDDGRWCGAVETDEPLAAELVLLLASLGRHDDPLIPLAANSLLKRQQADGTWGDLDASVRVYFALTVAGHAADAPHMRRADDAIRARGGFGAADALTHTYLALLGKSPFLALPAVQEVLLPKWLGGIDARPEWERAARVALGIVGAHASNGHRPFRRRAVRAAANWLRARYAEDGTDSNFRTLALTALALRCLGVPADDAEMRWVLAQIDSLCVVTGDELTVRPFRAPDRDTSLGLIAATDAGARPAGRDAAAWLLAHDGRPRDAATAALALTALARGGHVLSVAASAAVYRALTELLAAQNRDGGWGAFDRGVKGDPSCPAITATVLEAIGHFGFRVGQRPVDLAVRFVLDRQELDGFWRDRWGGCALRTTWQVLTGLHAAGCDVYGLPVRRAVRWLKEGQHADAGWGGPTDTACAVLALLVAGEGDSAEARAGVEFLAGTQKADGTWREPGFPGSGVAPGPRLRYELDSACLPLTAVSRYASGRGRPVEVRKSFVRADAGHAIPGPKGTRHTLAEM